MEDREIFSKRGEKDERSFADILAEEMDNDEKAADELNHLSDETKRKLMDAFRKYHAEKN